MRQFFYAMALLGLLALPSTAVDCPVSFDRPLVQGALIVGQAAAGSSVLFQGNPIAVSPDGQFVFGVARDDIGSVDIAVEGCVTTLTIGERQFQEERINGLPPKMVTQPPEWAARRRVERGRVGKARSVTDDRMDWTAGFLQPAEGRFSGFYGSRRILNGKPRSTHYGLDIAGPEGSQVIAPAGGIVRLAAPDFLLEGGIVIIDHGFGLTSTLFHLLDVDVAEGQNVAQGEKIGTIGSTGRATGPHVDWRINWGSVRLDPQLVLSGQGGAH